MYLLGVEVETTEGRFLDYAVLKATAGSTRLVTPRFKGTALGGLWLVLLVSVYAGLLSVPFLFFRVLPVIRWSPLPFFLFGTGVPVGFVVIIFLGLRLVQRLQVRYPKMDRRIRVLDVRPGKLHHEVVVQSDADTFVLGVRSFRRSLLDAIAISERSSNEGLQETVKPRTNETC